MAAGVPMIVAAAAATSPTMTETRKAPVNDAELRKETYHRSESPAGGNDRYSASLKDASTTIAIGSRRNRYTAATEIRSTIDAGLMRDLAFACARTRRKPIPTREPPARASEPK